MANTEQMHLAARAALGKGALREAHQHCLAILKVDPRHADAWFICGLIATRNGQPGKAMEILKKACEFDPQNADYQIELGKLLLANRQPEAARPDTIEQICHAPSTFVFRATGRAAVYIKIC